MFAELLSWWTAQMRGLVPVSFHSPGMSWRRRLVATIGGADWRTVELALLGRSGETRLGEFDAGDAALRAGLAKLPKSQLKSIRLRASASMVLEREIILPLAAEQDLDRVVAYEMDRQTPFRASDVYWSCTVERRDAARKQLHVRLTLIPQMRLQPVLDALHRAGCFPPWIEPTGLSARRRALPLGDAPGNRSLFGPRADALALGCCGVLAAIAVAMPFARQFIAFTQVEARIEAVRPQVTAAERLRGKIASGASAADAISVARLQLGVPLEAIKVLTDALPDDTYLTNLSARQRSYTFSGRSAAAARLIGAMTANPMIHNPAFTAPVIRDEVNGGETFSMRLEIGH